MALKATKNKKVVNALTQQEIELNEEAKLVDEQRAEFYEFVETYVMDLNKKPNDFIASMLVRMRNKRPLTENMVNALRKFMQPKQEHPRVKDESKLPKASFKVKQWWVKQNSINSRIVSGTILAETARAYLVKGYADMLENTSFCIRCGRELTEPASMVTGLGAICASKLGMPYQSDILSLPKKERQKIRQQYVALLNNQKFELWIPKSQVEEVLKMEVPAS